MNRFQRLREVLDAWATRRDPSVLFTAQCTRDVSGALAQWASGRADATTGDAWTVAFVLWYRFHLGGPPGYDREVAVALELFSSLIEPGGPPVEPAILGAIGRGSVLDDASWTGAMLAAMGAARAMSAHRPSAGAELLRRALSRAPADPAAQAPALMLLAFLVRRVGESAEDARTLDEAVAVAREAVNGFPPAHPQRPGAWGELANTLLSRFDAAGTRADLDEAVAAAEAALDEAPASPLGRDAFLAELTLTLFRRARETGSPADLDRAVEAGREAVACPGAPAAAWGNLAAALALRSERGSGGADLDEAVAAYRTAWDNQRQHALPDTMLAGFADSLRTRAQRTGSAADAAEAVAVLRAASPPGGALRYSSLCGALLTRAALSGDTGDLDAAVDAGRAAVAGTPPRTAHALSNLGNALVARYEHSGDPEDLRDATSALRSAAAGVRAGSPDLGRHLTNLANALRLAHERTGDATALDEAIESAQRAVAATPASHAEYPGYLLNLAAALEARMTARHSEADMRWVTDLLRSAVTISTVPDERAAAASALGKILLLRFERSGAHADLTEAVAAARLSISAGGATGPRHPVRLLTLANALRVASWVGKDPAAADEAVKASQSALVALTSLPPGHRSRTAALSSLGTCLFTRAQLHGRTDELREALLFTRQAWQETQAGDPALPLRTANLAAVQFAVTSQDDPAERDAVIAAMRDTVAQLADGSPYRAPVLLNLGVLLYTGAGDGQPGTDRNAAIGAWKQAARDTAAVSGDRLQAAYRWGAGAFHAALAGLAAEGYAYAAGLLPQVAWRGMDVPGRLRVGAEWQGLAGEAAAAALAAQAPAQAVELLEGTRGVAWTQLLELRSDLTHLEDAHGDLARRLRQIRLELDAGDAGAVDLPRPGPFR